MIHTFQIQNGRCGYQYPSWSLSPTLSKSLLSLLSVSWTRVVFYPQDALCLHCNKKIEKCQTFIMSTSNGERVSLLSLELTRWTISSLTCTLFDVKRLLDQSARVHWHRLSIISSISSQARWRCQANLSSFNLLSVDSNELRNRMINNW